MGARAHDVSNLWIVGSSVFITSATANSTLTIAALTLRIAAAFIANYKEELDYGYDARSVL